MSLTLSDSKPADLGWDQKAPCLKSSLGLLFICFSFIQQIFIETCDGLGAGEGAENIIFRPDTVLDIVSRVLQPGEGDRQCHVGMLSQGGEARV